MTKSQYENDVLVIGAGHAGVAAALAAARIDLLMTNCDTATQMICNPAVPSGWEGVGVRSWLLEIATASPLPLSAAGGRI